MCAVGDVGIQSIGANTCVISIWSSKCAETNLRDKRSRVWHFRSEITKTPRYPQGSQRKLQRPRRSSKLKPLAPLAPKLQPPRINCLGGVAKHIQYIYIYIYIYTYMYTYIYICIDIDGLCWNLEHPLEAACESPHSRANAGLLLRG